MPGKKALHLFVFSGQVILAMFGLQGEALCGMFFFQEIFGGPAGAGEYIYECTLFPVTAWDIDQSTWVAPPLLILLTRLDRRLGGDRNNHINGMLCVKQQSGFIKKLYARAIQ